MRTKLDDHPRFSAPKRPPHSFTVDHYAGQVTYSSLFMMDKNKDFVIAEHAQLMASSEFDFVRCGSASWGQLLGLLGAPLHFAGVSLSTRSLQGPYLCSQECRGLSADCHRAVQDHL